MRAKIPEAWLKITFPKPPVIILAVVLLLAMVCRAQTTDPRRSLDNSSPAAQSTRGDSTRSDRTDSLPAEDELRRGTALTRQGRFSEAIPHLLLAQRDIGDGYAVSFNLALCYLGVSEYRLAIPLLERLQRGHENADVENLLAQAYIGNRQDQDALAAVERAALISPQSEKLFAFVADACAQAQEYDLGLKVLEIGFRKLPQSARLHYHKGVLLVQLDQLDQAKTDFDLATRFGRDSQVGYLAAAYKNLLEGNIPDTIRIARQGIGLGFQGPTMLTILGQALLRSGVTPGQPEFTEALKALEQSIAERPNDASSQIAIGQTYLLAGRLDEAIEHLRTARQMKPNQPAIYASLAKAYQRKGDAPHAQEALAMLESLNQAQAERIRSAPGERKMSYGGTSSTPPE